jgi:hypothetical protein
MESINNCNTFESCRQGWQLRDGVLTPVAMDNEVAADDMLQIVHCKCRIETRNSCSSLLCSCRKHGLQCVASCNNFCGVSCENASSVTYSSSDAETESASEGEVALCETIEDPADDLIEDLTEYFIHKQLHPGFTAAVGMFSYCTYIINILLFSNLKLLNILI